jgi:hypothetical protein
LHAVNSASVEKYKPKYYPKWVITSAHKTKFTAPLDFPRADRSRRRPSRPTGIFACVSAHFGSCLKFVPARKPADRPKQKNPTFSRPQGKRTEEKAKNQFAAFVAPTLPHRYFYRVPAAAPGNGTVFAEPPRDSRRPVSIAVMSSSEPDKFSQVGDIFGEMDRRGSALRPSSAAAG